MLTLYIVATFQYMVKNSLNCMQKPLKPPSIKIKKLKINVTAVDLSVSVVEEGWVVVRAAGVSVPIMNDTNSSPAGAPISQHSAPTLQY